MVVASRRAVVTGLCLCAVVAGCRGGARPVEGDPAALGGSDPRASGPSEFAAVAAPPQFPKGGPPPPPSLANERPTSRPLGQPFVVVGATVYALTGHDGLQVAQIAGTPAVLGRLPLAGEPFGLFVEGTTAFAMMVYQTRAEPCSTCAGLTRLTTPAPSPTWSWPCSTWATRLAPACSAARPSTGSASAPPPRSARATIY